MISKAKSTEKMMIVIVLVIFGIAWAYPIVQAGIESFKINGFNNYISVINHPQVHYFRVLFNSLFVATCSAGIVTIFSASAAYAFSKMNFWGKNIFYYSLLACLAIPAAAVITPLFFTMKTVHLMNTYWSLILPSVAFNAPFMLLVLKNYFDTIPNSLLEAAQIDGSNSFQTFRIILLPLGIPSIVNIMVLTFIYTWNDFLMPLMFIRDENLYTVTLATQYFTGTRNQTPAMVAQLYAALVLMAVPSILIYLLSQKYYQEGLTAGSVKH